MTNSVATKSNVGYLRDRTEKAINLRVQQKLNRIKEQVQAFYNAMDPIADQGLFEGKYTKPLDEETIAQLSAEGVKIIDQGEGVCDSFLAKW